MWREMTQSRRQQNISLLGCLLLELHYPARRHLNADKCTFVTILYRALTFCPQASLCDDITGCRTSRDLSAPLWLFLHSDLSLGFLQSWKLQRTEATRCCWSVWRPSAAKLQQTSRTCCPSEQLDHWATVWLIQSHSGLTMMDRAGEREWQSGPENDRKGWMGKKKYSGERDCIFGSALPWPLAHFIFLLSVLLLNAVPPTAAVVSFFIVWYKMRLNQRVNGFTRLHMFFGAVEFLRKDCGLTFPSQPLSFSSPAQIVGQ